MYARKCVPELIGTRREGSVAATKAVGRQVAPRFGDLMETSERDLMVSAPVVALLRADGRVSAMLESAVAEADLTIPQFSVLMELAVTADGRLALSDVGRRCLKSPPNVTAIVDRLEAAGLVRRMRDESDRRVVQGEITERGWDALAVAAPRVFAAERLILKALSKADRAVLTELLGRVAT